MNKEKYITPNVEAVEIEKADVITTSPIDTSDELIGVDSTIIDPNDPLYKLF